MRVAFRVLASCALLGYLLSLIGCGSRGEGAGADAPVAAEPWGLGGQPAQAGPWTAEGARTVVLVVLDGVGPGDLGLEGTAPSPMPNLASVAAGALVATNAITASTGKNAAIASLLTGLHAREHGVGSVKDIGRASLAPASRTLAEGFQALGWTTVASLDSPLAARGFSGFAQGFDTYEAPRLGEPTRRWEGTAVGAVDALRPALEADESVFCLLSLGGFDGSRALEPSARRVVAHAERLLRPFASARADIGAALDLMEGSAAEGVQELGKVLGRSRTSEAGRAWRRALRDARLEEADHAIGDVLRAITGADRSGGAVVMVVGCRGPVPSADQETVGRRFLPEVYRVPLLMRGVGGAGAGEATGFRSILEVPRRLDLALGLGLGATAFGAADQVLVADTDLMRHASIGASGQVESQWPLGEQLAFDGSGAVLDASPLDGDQAALMRAFSSPPGLRVTATESAPGMELRWKLSEPRGMVVSTDGGIEDTTPRSDRRRGVRGRARSTGGAFTLDVGLERRTTSIRLEARTDEPRLDAGQVAVGPKLAPSTALLMTPIEDGPPVQEGETPAVTLDRSGGSWWKLGIQEPGEVELLVTVFPPRRPDEALGVETGGALRYDSVPGRLDLVRIWGAAPAEVRVKLRASESVALAASLDGAPVPAGRMAVAGAWAATESAMAWVLPSWQPAVSPAFGDLAADLYGDPGTPAEGWLGLSRSGLGPVRGATGAVPDRLLPELRRVPPGE